MQKIYEEKLKNEPGNSLMGKAGLPRERGSANLLAVSSSWSRVFPNMGTEGWLECVSVSHLKESARLWCQHHNNDMSANSPSPAWNDFLLLNRVTTGHSEGISPDLATFPLTLSRCLLGLPLIEAFPRVGLGSSNLIAFAYRHVCQ